MIKIEENAKSKTISVIMDFKSYDNAVNEFLGLLQACTKSDLAINAFNDALDRIMSK